MKIILLFVCVFVLSACSSTGDHKHSLVEGGKECNTLCKNNPEISEYSVKAGGGIPILFIGGMEQKCACRGRN